MIDLIPRHQLGYVLPVLVGDYLHQQFYRICPPDCHLVCRPLNLQSFSQRGSADALEDFWPAVEFLYKRGVDRIVQGGIPVSAFVGRPRILEMIAEMERRSGLACSADIEETIDGLKALGVRKIVVAAKWDDVLMGCIDEYVGHAGLEVVGHVADIHTAAQVVAITPKEGADMALALGRRAFTEFPAAEGLLLGGGAWPSMHAVPRLEAEFGKPVVSNPGATYWAALRQFKCKAAPGFGMLLDTL